VVAWWASTEPVPVEKGHLPLAGGIVARDDAGMDLVLEEAHVQVARSTGADRAARTLLALCLIGGPLAGVVVRAVVPASSTASAARTISDYAAHQGATRTLLIADAFLFLLVPAALAAAGLAWRRAPVLALTAAAASLVGWMAIMLLIAQDALAAVAGRPVYAGARATAITDSWSSETLVSIWIAAFIVGHIVGTVLLGAALWRARAVPRWAAIGIALSMPLHLLTVLTDFRAGDVAAWVLLLAGFGTCARVILTASDPLVAAREHVPATAVAA
jgi:hypothetical protein